MGSIYLFYGDDEAAVNEAKLRLLKQLLPAAEQREQNVTEFSPSANRFTLPLNKILGELRAELCTPSLFKDSFRIAIVYNLEAFYQREEAHKKLALSFLEFLRRQFQHSPNVLIFVCAENPDKGRWINMSCPLFLYVKEQGQVRGFRSQLRQNLIDSLIARDGLQALKDLRRWWARTKSAVPIFNALVGSVELLLQAKLLREKKRYALEERELKEKFLKRTMTVSIFKEYPQRQKKFLSAGENFTLRELLSALEKLLELNQYVFPQQSDKYVPDIHLLLETFVLEFTSSYPKDEA